MMSANDVKTVYKRSQNRTSFIEGFAMNNLDTVSIIVPVYNCEKYVSKCIASIIKQTYREWKLILVDDGSTDAGGGICDRFAKKDDRIIVIHQENRGSVEARRAGVLNSIAQKNPWLIFSDADDVWPRDALRKLVNAARKYHAEMVVGRIQKMYKGIVIPSKWCSPCFKITEPRKYTNAEIIEELFISYFGITDFPVNLVGKLYQTKQITRAINYPPVVKFMGDDLSVSIRITPEIESLVIIPDVVYNYRIGGGTSKFMPYMMDDFASLYSYKAKFAKKYPMPQNVQFYMDVELMNTTKTHFLQCLENGRFTVKQLKNEILNVCKMEQVKVAAGNLVVLEKEISEYAKYLYEIDVECIINYINNLSNQNRMKKWIKKMLLQF